MLQGTRRGVANVRKILGDTAYCVVGSCCTVVMQVPSAIIVVVVVVVAVAIEYHRSRLVD